MTSMVQQGIEEMIVMSQTPTLPVFWMRQQRPFQGDPWDMKDNNDLPREITRTRGTTGRPLGHHNGTSKPSLWRWAQRLTRPPSDVWYDSSWPCCGAIGATATKPARAKPGEQRAR